MPANLNTLPLETLTQITRDLTDPTDLVSALVNMRSIRLTSTRQNSIAQATFRPEAMREVNRGLMRNVPILEEMLTHGASDTVQTDQGAVSMQKLITATHLIPLKKAADRSSLVNDALQRGPDAFPVVSNLILNMDYLSADDRSQVANYVGDSLGVFRPADRLFEQIAGKAELLTHEDRSKLVRAGCERQVPWNLIAWAGKMNLLEAAVQSRALSVACLDHGYQARALRQFAEHADKLTPDNQAVLTKHVLALSADSDPPEKWRALRHLAEHLPSLAEPAREWASQHIVDKISIPVAGEDDNRGMDADWYSRADFCKLEALHHLATHRTLLRPYIRERVDAFVAEKIDRTDAQRFVDQAQLITHLPEAQRRDLMEAVPTVDFTQRSAVAYVLTARVKDLTDEERQIYTSLFMDGNSVGGYTSRKTISYNVENNLEYFNYDQVKLIVKEQCLILNGDRNNHYISYSPRHVSLELESIASNYKILKRDDIERIVDTTRRVVDHYMESPKWQNRIDDIKSCSGHAVRCLMGWASETMFNPRAAQWEVQAEAVDVPSPQAGPSTEVRHTGKRKREETPSDDLTESDSPSPKRQQLEPRSRSSSVER